MIPGRLPLTPLPPSVTITSVLPGSPVIFASGNPLRDFLNSPATGGALLA